MKAISSIDAIRDKMRLSHGILLAVGLFLVTLSLHKADYLADDGAFFLRYAENMAHGYFWYWNMGDGPVWGASAPFWPLFIALPLSFGLDPITAVRLVSYLFALSAFLLVTWVLNRRYGALVAAAFALLLSVNAPVMYHSVSGLESPLTYLLLALAVWSILQRSSQVPAGLVAAGLTVHKIDLVPVAFFLLAAIWLRDRKLPVRAVVITSLGTTLWYGFATLYFGAPVPNSLLTKLGHYEYAIPRGWFLYNIAFQGMRAYFLFFALLSLPVLWRKDKPLLLLSWGTIITHLIVYTWRPPSETFAWYYVPSQFLMTINIALGLRYFIRPLATPKLPTNLRFLLGSLFLVVLATLGWQLERPQREVTKAFANHHEADRTNAGRWVAQHTPPEATVYTGFGNTSYWSRRYVYDYSFLNRPFEEGDLVTKYRPDVIILCPVGGPPPVEYEPREGYRVGAVFDKTYRAGDDFYAIVLLRQDQEGVSRLNQRDPVTAAVE